MIKQLVFALITLVALSSCAHKVKQRTQVVTYADFGPQAIAYDLLGKDKEDTGSTLYTDPVYVVVYEGVPLKKVEKHYPSIPEKHIDYRYITLEEALSYLDKHISKDYWTSLSQRLQKTRQILTHNASDGIETPRPQNADENKPKKKSFWGRLWGRD